MAEGSEVRAEGSELRAEGSELRAEGSELEAGACTAAGDHHLAFARISQPFHSCLRIVKEILSGNPCKCLVIDVFSVWLRLHVPGL